MLPALAAIADYPSWWPQVREVERIDDERAAVVVRSVLPYTLNLVLTREVEDLSAGVLRVGISGDLVGFAQWDVRAGEAATAPGGDTGAAGGTVAEFSEEVEVTGALGLAARPAAPLMRANHLAMMRGGERGLRRWLGDAPT